MLETMQAASGVGLAAQQVGRALQIAVLDVRDIEDRPSAARIGGKAVGLEVLMPLVLVNPGVRAVGEPVTGPEGCLSFPEIFSEIARPDAIEVTALNIRGERQEFWCSGLLARAIQHEVDHLNGILFIDRMDSEAKRELKPQLETLSQTTKAESPKPATTLYSVQSA
jgi:peptide deformylase